MYNTDMSLTAGQTCPLRCFDVDYPSSSLTTVFPGPCSPQMTASWILVGRGTTVVAVLMHLIQPFAQLSTIILQIFSSHFSIADCFTQLSS